MTNTELFELQAKAAEECGDALVCNPKTLQEFETLEEATNYRIVFAINEATAEIETHTMFLELCTLSPWGFQEYVLAPFVVLKEWYLARERYQTHIAALTEIFRQSLVSEETSFMLARKMAVR